MNLVVIEGNMTTAKYRYKILNDIILPFQHAHPTENFILVDDNATSYRTRVVTAYKQANNIITEDWPARSPDRSVIEHAWDASEGCLRATTSPKYLAELSVAVQEEWNNLDQNKLRRPVRKVPNRCR